MRKTATIATCLLVALVGFLGYQSHNQTRSEIGWNNVDGIAMRTDDPTVIDKAAIQPTLTQINEDLLINGKPIITTTLPFVHPRISAIDNSDGTRTDAERKEMPNRPKPPRFVKARISHSIAAIVD